MPDNRKFKGRSSINVSSILGAAGLGAPEANPDFGAEPGMVDFNFDGDPSALAKQPYAQPNFWQKMAGNPADKLNQQYRMSSALGEAASARSYANASALQELQQQLQMEDELRKIETKKAKEAHYLGDYLPRQLEIENNAKLLQHNAMREGAARAAASRLMPDHFESALNSQPQVLLPEAQEQGAYPVAMSSALREAYRLGPDNVLSQGTEVARQGVAQASQKTRKGELDNIFQEAQLPWAEYTKLGDSMFNPRGQAFTSVPGQKAVEPVFDPVTKKWTGGSPATPPSLVRGSVAGLEPDGDGFLDRATGLNIAPKGRAAPSAESSSPSASAPSEFKVDDSALKALIPEAQMPRIASPSPFMPQTSVLNDPDIQMALRGVAGTTFRPDANMENVATWALNNLDTQLYQMRPALAAGSGTQYSEAATLAEKRRKIANALKSASYGY